MTDHESPSLVTELHVHLVNSSLEYRYSRVCVRMRACVHVCMRACVCVTVTVCLCVCRPLYLPLVATLVLDFVSLSTSVVSGAPVHVVRVVLDGLHLLLTPSRTSNATPSHHSVCVLDVEWLEVTLRHCNNAMLNQDFPNVRMYTYVRIRMYTPMYVRTYVHTYVRTYVHTYVRIRMYTPTYVCSIQCDCNMFQLFSKMPDVTLECASNAVHIRVCVDSCIALCDLLVYLSSQRDLSPPASPATADTQDYSSLPSTLPSPSPATSAAGSVRQY